LAAKQARGRLKSNYEQLEDTKERRNKYEMRKNQEPICQAG